MHKNTNWTRSELMSQRLSLPCRLVKDGPSDIFQVHPNKMDAQGKDKDAWSLRSDRAWLELGCYVATGQRACAVVV